jgi:hypothetical protein
MLKINDPEGRVKIVEEDQKRTEINGVNMKRTKISNYGGVRVPYPEQIENRVY